jgi:hypothetical protein
LGGDGTLAPNAAVAVLEFKARFSGDAVVDDKRWTELIGMARELSDSGVGANSLPATVAKLLDVKVGAPSSDGSVDWLLRVPPTRLPA